ncbi:hypothetical protein PAHAL_6G121600 [Panicum hallii]|jgi:hypothetical protein|uniref:Uncharacterized protein n=1 Tax=Panicum hallii TaxID=206008 RepID=A0A2T8IG27_9POAL|nr:uncharacterized protein LOC112897238 isoform X1 [Panicum hallii]PVH36611.1 hypothetical protein PAHAL_6G121600 [Panicum hallii]
MAAGKKARVVLAQPAAGAPPPRPPPLFSRAHGPVRGSGDEAAYRARLRYQALLHDYQELVKEAQAKKRRLHMERLNKQRLLAEVKFLRKRYKSMSENPSQTIVCRVRNPAMRPACRTAAWANDAQHRSVHAIGSSSRSQLLQWRQDDSPRASLVIDLNEACEPGYEEMEMGDHHGYREPLGFNKVRRYPMEDAAAGPSEVRIPAFWDARSPVGRAGKRKISWQDQLALRV